MTVRFTADIDVSGAVAHITGATAQALQAGADVLAEAATNEAPRDQGDLAGSLEVSIGQDQATLEYGARDPGGRPYPTFVHEKWNPWFARAADASHDDVRQAMRDEMQL